MQRLLALLAGIANKHNTGIDAIAARWALDQPTVAAIILGTGSRSRAEENLKIGRIQLDDEDRHSIAECLEGQTIPQGDPYDLERDASSVHSGIIRTHLQDTSVI